MNPFEQMFQIANATIDGTATAADLERLSALLRDHPELQDEYLRYLDTHAALCWQFRDQTPTPAPAPQTTPRQRSLLAAALPWFVTALAIVAALVTVFWPTSSKQIEAPTAKTSPPPTDGTVALMVDETGAEFAAGRAPNGKRLTPGSYELKNGIVHLRFTQGAEVLLVAPARLDVQDAQHARLVYGKVRVTATPNGKGFTLATRDVDYIDPDLPRTGSESAPISKLPTRDVDYIDLGTEFGLNVDTQNGTSDLYVFAGQVNVAKPQNGQVLSEVTRGKSSRCSDGKLELAPELKETDFPTPSVIGLKRWEQYERELREDKTLIAFFPFRRTENENVLLNGVRENTATNGHIVGARWTTGRWPGKDALLFDRDTDHVQINIPGEHQELTIAAWVNVERLLFVLNAILNSDGYEPGGIHFQLNRQGFLRGGLIVDGPFQDRVIGKPIPLGDWVHVASVLSTQTRTQQIYVNGALVRERSWNGEKVLRPGSCRLGNWLTDKQDSFGNRALRGRIDELAVWKRAVTESQVKRLVEAGRPGPLRSENFGPSFQ